MADHCIGPQLSFSAVEEDSDVEPRSGRNTAVLTQGVSEFQSYYGSVSAHILGSVVVYRMALTPTMTVVGNRDLNIWSILHDTLHQKLGS